jgi:hypothetical protein
MIDFNAALLDSARRLEASGVDIEAAVESQIRMPDVYYPMPKTYWRSSKMLCRVFRTEG